MSGTAPLLIEIGCEEIPARMISAAAADLGERLERILDEAALDHGKASFWGGSRRLAVRVEAVQGRQADRDEQVLGPPAKVAFTPDGELSKAALGFARKQGIEPAQLSRIETDRGEYVGFDRRVAGRSVAQVLADRLPERVASMSFPKTMRWADGLHRWVRPVHWLLALHGDVSIELELFGVAAGAESRGHRFLSDGIVPVGHPDDYIGALERECVLVENQTRVERIDAALRAVAAEFGGAPVPDPELLAEAANLVEWPGVVGGRFDLSFLDLPRELLVTTLRHHQKCFSVQDDDGTLLPNFLALANTDRDEAGHVQRGNEWVVGGRLDDARFFWNEDRKRPLAERSPDLDRVMLHAKLGSYGDKARRLELLATGLAERLDLGSEQTEHCRRGAGLAKNDLVTGSVGEFPELQGQIGGLLLEAEGVDAAVAAAVYEHYQPNGPDDPVPPSIEGAVVSVADKLDAVASFVGVGLHPTGSRDPYGLRRAANGVLRVVLGRNWPLSLRDLVAVSDGDDPLREFLRERLVAYLRDAGYGANEIRAVLRPQVDPEAVLDWRLPDVLARLDAIRSIRGRADFVQLVKLTQRVDTIVRRNAELVAGLTPVGEAVGEADDVEAAAVLLRMTVEEEPRLAGFAGERDYAAIIDSFAAFVGPVEAFFEDVLVIDNDNASATVRRYRLLSRLKDLLTRYFDVRELAGQAGGT